MTTARDILDGLNPAQREAVEHVEGALMIVAGPGSGKTRVITHRVAYLVKVCGISPHRVLAVTFTNKAAKEMTVRLQRLVGTRAEHLTVGTFHAFCASVLRRYGKSIGVEANFTIYDDTDQMDLLKMAMEEADLNPRQFNLRAIKGVISKSKSLLVDAHNLTLHHENFFEERAARVYVRYEELLTRNNAVDFDDLLMKAVVLLRNDTEVLKRYQERFLHILIDEFQDTNVAQYALSTLLTGKNNNICVVGDPDQSIYSWRNADIRNILSFKKDYPEAKTVILDENYRSSGTILKAAKKLISANRLRVPKDLWTSNGEGKSIVVHEAYTEEEEARFVLKEVERLAKEENISPGECAVMYRVNAQSRALEEACLRYGMKYRLVGGVRFYQRREVKDVLCYLRLLANPDDEVSLSRVINTPPRGIGQQTVQHFLRWVKSLDETNLLEAMDMLGDSEKSNRLPPHGLSTRAVKALSDFAILIKSLRDDSLRLNVTELISAVQERIGYWKYVEKLDKPEERMENLMELRVAAQAFDSFEPPKGLGILLEQLALVADVDSYDESEKSLTLITLHQAKGLEFRVVFIVGMEEGLLPHSRSMDSPEELEEERRLCYVGITRSQDQLYLLRAFRRGMMGRTSPSIASRYLGEIPSNLIASLAPRVVAPILTWDPNGEENGKAERVLPAFSTGDRVEHATFGEGVVVSCVRSGSDYEITVAFKDGAGVKRLLQGYAPLTKLT